MDTFYAGQDTAQAASKKYASDYQLELVVLRALLIVQRPKGWRSRVRGFAHPAIIPG